MENKYPFILILSTLAASIPPILGYDFILDSGYHDTQRFSQLILITIAGIFSIYRKDVTRSNISNIILTAIVVFGIVSTINSKNKIHAVFEISIIYLSIILIQQLSIEYSRNKEKFNFYLFRLLTIGLSFYFFSFCIYLTLSYLQGATPIVTNLIPGYDNYRFLNHAQTITIPLLTFLIISIKENYSSNIFTKIAFCDLCLSWSIVFATAGRGSILSLLIATIFIYFVEKDKSRKFINLIIKNALIGFLIYLIFFIILPKLLYFEITEETASIILRTYNNPLSNREILWGCALDAIKESPLFGISPMGFSNYCKLENSGAHPHNILIQIFTEWGILFFLLTLTTIFFKTKKSYKYIKTKNPSLKIFFLFSTTSIMIDGLVSGIFVMPTSQIWIAISFGIIFTEEKTALPKRSNYLIKSLTLIIIIALLLSGKKTFEYSIKNQNTTDIPISLLKPRAWSAGYLD